PGVSSSTVNPGSTLDIAIEGTVTGDSIKCVTSKGTVLPEKMGERDGTAGPDPDDYISIFGVTASVSMAQTVYKHNVQKQTWGARGPHQQLSGCLTDCVPGHERVTVSYIARGGAVDRVGGGLPDSSSMPYNAGRRFPVPVRDP